MELLFWLLYLEAQKTVRLEWVSEKKGKKKKKGFTAGPGCNASSLWLGSQYLADFMELEISVMKRYKCFQESMRIIMQFLEA